MWSLSVSLLTFYYTYRIFDVLVFKSYPKGVKGCFTLLKNFLENLEKKCFWWRIFWWTSLEKVLVYKLHSMFVNCNFEKEKREVIKPLKIVCRGVQFHHNTTWCQELDILCNVWKMIGLWDTSWYSDNDCGLFWF